MFAGRKLATAIGQAQANARTFGRLYYVYGASNTGFYVE